MYKRSIYNPMQVMEKEEVTLHLRFLNRKWLVSKNLKKSTRGWSIVEHVNLNLNPNPNPNVYTNPERIDGRMK